MAYTKTTWVNDQEPAINAINLNKMEQGIEDAHGLAGTPGEDGTDGREVLLQKSATHIQWQYDGDESWTNLVALSDITGPDGEDGAPGAAGAAGAAGIDGEDGSDASVTKENVEAVLTGEISSHSHAATGLTQPQVLARSLGC